MSTKLEKLKMKFMDSDVIKVSEETSLMVLPSAWGSPELNRRPACALGGAIDRMVGRKEIERPRFNDFGCDVLAIQGATGYHEARREKGCIQVMHLLRVSAPEGSGSTDGIDIYATPEGRIEGHAYLSQMADDNETMGLAILGVVYESNGHGCTWQKLTSAEIKELAVRLEALSAGDLS